MKTITIRDLRQRWPEVEAVLQAEDEIIVTRDSKPVAKLVPVDDEPLVSLFGYLKGRTQIVGDIVTPTGIAWDAEK